MLLAGSLKLVWGLIELLQIVVKLRLFNNKTPGNVVAFLNYFEEFAKFDLYDVEEFTMSWNYFPEAEEDIQVNFESAGYDT